jgi:hypothetical protein
MPLTPKKTIYSYPFIVLISALISCYLFFLNPTLSSAFDSSKENIEWYAVLSQTLFEPQSFYIAESILLPLLAKIIHANETTITFRLLCSALTISILPIIATCYQAKYKNTIKTLILIGILTFTFQYLTAFNLGFPDPLTLILIAIAVLTTSPIAIFSAISLAALSHFSMTLVGVVLVIPILLFYDRPTQKSNIVVIKSLILGLIAGKLFLYLWNTVFSYHLIDRTAWAVQHGMDGFIRRYTESPSAFWLMPGAPFLFAYVTIVLFFLSNRKYVFSSLLVVILGIAYATCFFTLDGLRVFAVIILAAYLLLLSLFIDQIYPYLQTLYARYQQTIRRAQQKINAQILYIALGFPLLSSWLYLIKVSKSKGLLFNDPTILQPLGLTDNLVSAFLLSTALAIFIILMLPVLRTHRLITGVAKIIFFFPLTLIFIQYLRQIVAPNESLTLMMKIVCGFLLIAMPLLTLRLNITSHVATFEAFIRRRVTALR